MSTEDYQPARTAWSGHSRLLDRSGDPGQPRKSRKRARASVAPCSRLSAPDHRRPAPATASTRSPVATVRRWLGVFSWNDVLARCHLPHPPVGDSLERNWNHAYDEHEAVAAVRACAEELKHPPSWWEYVHRSDASTSAAARDGGRARSGLPTRLVTAICGAAHHGGDRRSLMRQSQVSERVMADALGWSVGAVRRMVSGRLVPTVGEARSLAAVLADDVCRGCAGSASWARPDDAPSVRAACSFAWIGAISPPLLPLHRCGRGGGLRSLVARRRDLVRCGRETGAVWVIRVRAFTGV
jgi:hypothetical protein